MASASQGLILKFGTDLLPAQKSIQDFALNCVSQLSSLGKAAVESQKTLETLGSAATALRGAVAAFAAFEAFKFTLDAMTDAADKASAELTRLVKIADDAKGAGVGSTFFQQFTDGSKKLGLEASDLTGILAKLREASTVSLGSGDDKDPKSAAQNAIAAHVSAGNLGEGASDAFASADDQPERLKVALNLLTELQNKSFRLAELDLAGKLFGSDFEGKLRNDTDLVNKLQQRLTDMANGKGANVVPPEQLEAAREMDAEMEDLNNRVINALTPFHNDLRGWQQEELRATLELKGYWVDIVEVFGRLYAWCENIGKQISSWGNASFFHSIAEMADKSGLLLSDVHAFRDKQGNLTTLENARAAGTEPPDRTSKELDLTITRPKGDKSNPLPEKKKGGTDHEDTDPIENYINELKKAAATEEAEAKTVGLGVKAKQEAVDIAKALAIAAENDRTLTAAETEEVKKQADAYADAKIKIEQFTKSQEQAKEQAQFFGTQFESSIEKIVLNGGRLADVFKQFATALEQAALKALILGEGPLAGLLGTAPQVGATGSNAVGGLFGALTGSVSGGLLSGIGKTFGSFFGFHADGGSIPAGGWGVAGEAGPEIIHGPASVIPMSALRVGGGVGAVTHAPTYVLPQPAAGVTPAQLQSTLAAYDRDSQRNLLSKITKAQQRF